MALPEEVKKRRQKIVITLSPRAEDLLRAQNRRKGDMSRIVEELILEKYGRVLQPEPAASSPA